MNTALRIDDSDLVLPELRYGLLKAGLAVFGKAPDELSPEEWRRALAQARRTYDIESRVLAAPVARGVRVPEAKVRDSIETIARRYPGKDEFVSDMERNGVDEARLAAALRRELMVEAVMERVGRQAEPVTEIEVEIFFYEHADRMQRPERRTVRHILVTINDAFRENRREAALARIDSIAGALAGGGDFAALAQRHSECPSALEGGLIGTVESGRLYPTLDAALFALNPGAVSGVVESEMGFHLLRCEAVEPAGAVTFADAAGSIRERLTRRARERHARKWLAGLVGN